MTENANPYADAGFVDASHYRADVLRRLRKQPSIPSVIAREQLNNEDHITHVSRSLGELRERELVELLVPEDRTKGRVYGITDRGREALKKVEEMNG